MKIDKEIQEKLLKNLEQCHVDVNRMFDDYSKKLEKAENVEGIMLAKQSFLLEIVKNLPLGTANCYFCLRHSPALAFEGCVNCQWGKVHGKCCSATGDYHKIQTLRQQLENEIRYSYYGGEIYK